MKTYKRRSGRVLGATLASLMVFAVACGGGDDGGSSGESDTTEGSGTSEAPSTEAPEGEPVVGGTLRVGLEADVDGLNPTASALAVSGLTMAQAVFDPLFTFTADGDVVPYLAESITPNADFTEWTLKLREGVTFHD